MCGGTARLSGHSSPMPLFVISPSDLELFAQPERPRLLVERLAVVDDVDVAAEVADVSSGV